MLSVKEAKTIIKNNIPNGNIKSCVLYKNLYVFIVYTDDEIEGEMDPFYSVDSDNGKFNGFPMMNHITDVLPLFSNPLF